MSDAVQAPSDSARRRRLGERLGRHLYNEPALWIPIAYLCTAALGLWASFWYYRPFKIPILQYMQAGDFLVAGLRDPIYFLLVLGSFAIGWLTSRVDVWRERDPQRLERLRRHWWGRMLAPRWQEHRWWIGSRMSASSALAASVIWATMWLVLGYVEGRADSLLEGKGTQIALHFAGIDSAGAQSALLIGTTAEWVLVYWPDRHAAETIPQQSIARIGYPEASRKPDRR